MTAIKKKSKLKRISVIIVAVLLIFITVSMVVTKIVYDSVFVRYDGTISVTEEPLKGLVSNRENKVYYSGENKLSGYLYRCESSNDNNTLVVVAPGHNSSADNYLWQIKSLLDYGWSVFAFDSTGSCNSEGDSQVGFPQILSDLNSTIKYIEKNDRFGYNEIVLFGHSKGGYAACCALSYDYDISAVVSVSGVNSAMEGVIGLSTQHVGFLAYGNYGFLWLYQAMLFGSDTLNMCADEEISQSDVPVMVIHGNNDELIPMDKFSIISYSDEIESDNVTYYVCDKDDQNGHTNLLFDKDGTANDELMEEINAFLEQNIDN